MDWPGCEKSFLPPGKVFKNKKTERRKQAREKLTTRVDGIRRAEAFLPLSGFPHAHIISLMNQLPVRKGMKVAFEKWKAVRGAVREKQTRAEPGRALTG